MTYIEKAQQRAKREARRKRKLSDRRKRAHTNNPNHVVYVDGDNLFGGE